MRCSQNSPDTYYLFNSPIPPLGNSKEVTSKKTDPSSILLMTQDVSPWTEGLIHLAKPCRGSGRRGEDLFWMRQIKTLGPGVAGCLNDSKRGHWSANRAQSLSSPCLSLSGFGGPAVAAVVVMEAEHERCRPRWDLNLSVTVQTTRPDLKSAAIPACLHHRPPKYAAYASVHACSHTPCWKEHAAGL